MSIVVVSFCIHGPDQKFWFACKRLCPLCANALSLEEHFNLLYVNLYMQSEGETGSS